MAAPTPSNQELLRFPEMALLAAIVESSDDAIISKSLSGIIQSWNSAAERIYGYTKAEAVGQPITMLIPEDRLPEETLILEKIKRGERVEHFETVRMHKDGSRVLVSLTVSPIKDAAGQIIGASKSARDITERKRIEEDLKSLTLELESRVSQRTHALTVSQGRLRGLATQLSLAEERVRRSLATELHDYLGQLLVVCRLKLSHAKKGNAEQRDQQVQDADRLLHDAITYTRSLVAQLTPPVLREFGLIMGLTWLGEHMKHQGLNVGMTLNVPAVLLSEEHAILIFQSVRELLMNIVKHAGTTDATLTVDQAQGVLVATIQDRGRGFDPSAEPSTTEPHFGLFSIRERMEAVGGHLSLTSVPGEGTTARLSLLVQSIPQPNRPSSEADSAQAVSSDRAIQMQSVRVLMVDDHPMVRQGLRAIVEQFEGIQVVGEAADGLEAVRLAESLQPDVVIMDVNLPTMDGVEATRQITASMPHVVVIGLSVHNSPQVESAMKEAGAAAYLTKDAASDKLQQTIFAAVLQRHTMS
ncbi:MAG: PAS domain S-box protein [Nitrospiraceae bacterium]|nr:MAG: PAS domain S-box protein [Nitrospiraceae bacterium]